MAAFDPPDDTGEAKLVEVGKTYIILELSDGTYYRVPKKQLSAADRKFLREFVFSAECALLSRNVYGDDTPPPGWEVKETFTRESGLKATLYYHRKRNVYVLAYKGTVPTSNDDLSADAQQIYSDTPQYRDAVNLANAMKRRYGSEKLIFTGHSLGGGLAYVSAMATGNYAVVFNAAGISKKSAMALNLDLNKPYNRIYSYYIPGEWLTGFQNNLENKWPKIIVVRPGQQIRLSPPSDSDSVFYWHTINAVIKGMGLE